MCAKLYLCLHVSACVCMCLHVSRGIISSRTTLTSVIILNINVIYTIVLAQINAPLPLITFQVK